MKNIAKIVVLVVSLLSLSCKEEKKVVINNNRPVIKRIEPKEVAFTFQKSEDWLKSEGTNTKALNIVLAVNRVDIVHLKKLDSILVPTDVSGDLEFYMPFPLEVSTLNDVKKIIGQHLLIHEAETWKFLSNGKLVLKAGENERLVDWKIKGRGNILQLKYDDNVVENYNLTELDNNTMILNFDSEIQARGIAKLTFEKS